MHLSYSIVAGSVMAKRKLVVCVFRVNDRWTSTGRIFTIGVTALGTQLPCHECTITVILIQNHRLLVVIVLTHIVMDPANTTGRHKDWLQNTQVHNLNTFADAIRSLSSSDSFQTF